MKKKRTYHAAPVEQLRLEEVLPLLISAGCVIALDVAKEKFVVALATLALTISNQGAQYAAIESRSMIVGAIAFFVYAACVCGLLLHLKLPALLATLPSIVIWLGAAIAAWYVSLR